MDPPIDAFIPLCQLAPNFHGSPAHGTMGGGGGLFNKDPPMDALMPLCQLVPYFPDSPALCRSSIATDFVFEMIIRSLCKPQFLSALVSVVIGCYDGFVYCRKI